MAPSSKRRLGRTTLRVTRLGLGTAPLAGLFEAVAEDEARAVCDRAWELGLRTFDTAPLYGYGLSEQRVGRALRDRPRDEYVLSTKVGRHLRDDVDPPPGEAQFKGAPPLVPVFDFSYDGVRRSLEESLERLGLERVDIVHIHDPDEHWEEAISGAYPALESLRAQGVVSAIGAGMNQAEMLARFAREGDFDCFLVAGRYTLLDQPALSELLPLCEAKQIAVFVGGAYNSGILANPDDAPIFDYVPAPPERVERARALRDVCERHGVPLKAAALQFPLAHPAVACLLTGVRSTDELEENVRMAEWPVAGDLWEELRAEGLLPEEAPTPS